MIRAGIVGGAGYTAGELIRLIINHPALELDFVYSTSNAGNEIAQVHSDLEGEVLPRFTSQLNPEVEVLFLCLGHGNSTKFLKQHNFSEFTHIIDLSNDFRLKEESSLQEKEFVYGLPELNSDSISKSKYIANPGCFATAIELALLPLAQAGLLEDDIHVNAVTGATGAGVSLSSTTHFTWRDNNFSHYKAFAHQHLDEINQSILQAQPTWDQEIYFLPNRGNFSRGIFATAYTTYAGDLDLAYELYEAYYKNSPFTFVSKREVFLKQVVNTNKCLIHLHKHKDKLLVTSVIDNLLKGASGQAIENMNLMFGLDQKLGLELKANFF
jgi:N-acetyl-gamma-glutamyl-phosphate reductase